MGEIGVQAALKIMTDFIFIFVTFWAIRGVRTEKWLKKHYVPHGQVLYIFLSIAIGYNVSNFVYGLIISSQNLVFLF